MHAIVSATRAFRERHYSKRSRIEQLEQTVAILNWMVKTIWFERLTTMRDAMREGKATKEMLETLSWMTSFKKGDA